MTVEVDGVQVPLRQQLTVKFVATLKAEAKSYEIHDTVATGLSMIVHPSGRRVWAWRGRERGKLKKYTLGQYPLHTLDAARRWAGRITEARDLFDYNTAKTAPTRSPSKLKECGEKTCDWLFAYYMSHDGRRLRSALQKKALYQRNVQPFIGAKRLLEVTLDDLDDVVSRKAQTAPSQATLTRALLLRMFGLASTKYRRITALTHNPATGLVGPRRSAARTRYLSIDELCALMNVLSGERDHFSDALRFMLYTAARKSEVFQARWCELDFERRAWMIPAERSKNGLPHLLPLPNRVFGWLTGRVSHETVRSQALIFSSGSSRDNEIKSLYRRLARVRSRANDMLASESTAPEWTFHDLRRTVATGMHGLLSQCEEPLIVADTVERLLNHKIGGAREIYNRYDYIRPKRAALKIWADYLDGLTVRQP